MQDGWNKIHSRDRNGCCKATTLTGAKTRLPPNKEERWYRKDNEKRESGNCSVEAKSGLCVWEGCSECNRSLLKSRFRVTCGAKRQGAWWRNGKWESGAPCGAAGP